MPSFLHVIHNIPQSDVWATWVSQNIALSVTAVSPKHCNLRMNGRNSQGTSRHGRSKCMSLNVIVFWWTLVQMSSPCCLWRRESEEPGSVRSASDWQEIKYCLSLPTLHWRTMSRCIYQHVEVTVAEGKSFIARRKASSSPHCGWGSVSQPCCVSPFVFPSILTLFFS